MSHTPRHPGGGRATKPRRCASLAPARKNATSASGSKTPRRATARVVGRHHRHVRVSRQIEIARRAAAPTRGKLTLPRAASPVATRGAAAPIAAPAQTSAPCLPPWLCHLAFKALVALAGRAEADSRGYRLDGKPATLRQLVLAAQETGAALPYPGVRPHDAAFHTGPSAAPPAAAGPRNAPAGDQP